MASAKRKSKITSNSRDETPEEEKMEREVGRAALQLYASTQHWGCWARNNVWNNGHDIVSWPFTNRFLSVHPDVQVVRAKIWLIYSIPFSDFTFVRMRLTKIHMYGQHESIMPWNAQKLCNITVLRYDCNSFWLPAGPVDWTWNSPRILPLCFRTRCYITSMCSQTGQQKCREWV